jgi:hypothetical protein
MSLLQTSEVQQQYPNAWQHIEDEMQKARDGYATTLVPMAAEVLTVDGDEVLEIVAVSDISIDEDGEDGEESFARMTFHAKLTQS